MGMQMMPGPTAEGAAFPNGSPTYRGGNGQQQQPQAQAYDPPQPSYKPPQQSYGHASDDPTYAAL